MNDLFINIHHTTGKENTKSTNGMLMKSKVIYRDNDTFPNDEYGENIKQN